MFVLTVMIETSLLHDVTSKYTTQLILRFLSVLVEFCIRTVYTQNQSFNTVCMSGVLGGLE